MYFLNLVSSLQNIKKEDVKEENASTNGASPVKSENGKTSSSVVSWLSDIPIKTETKDEKSDSSSSDSDETGNFSTLRELLIRPAPEGTDTQPKKKQKKNKSEKLADDVISSVVDEKKDEDGEVKPFAISNVVKRYERGRGREELPIRIMTLIESKLLYPDVPHAWLCDGKLLHLTDPAHPGNYKPFQVNTLISKDFSLFCSMVVVKKHKMHFSKPYNKWCSCFRTSGNAGNQF